MVNAHVKNAVDVVVVEGIEHGLSASAHFDKLGVFQHAELVRNSGLCQTQETCDIANAKLGLAERVENADSRRIAEYLEKFSEIVKRLFFGHFLQNVVHNVFVYAEKFAFFDRFLAVHIIFLSV